MAPIMSQPVINTRASRSHVCMSSWFKNCAPSAARLCQFDVSFKVLGEHVAPSSARPRCGSGHRLFQLVAYEHHVDEPGQDRFEQSAPGAVLTRGVDLGGHFIVEDMSATVVIHVDDYAKAHGGDLAPPFQGQLFKAPFAIQVRMRSSSAALSAPVGGMRVPQGGMSINLR
jgi:hypothetical protein